MSRVRPLVLKGLYGALFVVALPGALWMWAHRLDAWLMLPVPFASRTGLGLAVFGLAVMLAGTLSLWRHGHGLPMSAFPPERLVARGVYRVIADPLYVGAVVAVVGVSLWQESAGGLWVVSPVLALACVAWVMGFERDLTREHFGDVAHPLLALPADTDAAPTRWHRASVVVLVFLPWLLFYMSVEYLGAPIGAPSSYIALDYRIPIVPWTELLYELVYPLVVLVPFAAPRQRELRQFARRGLWATLWILLFYLIVPVVAEPRHMPGEGWWQTIHAYERALNSPLTAFPAFHVVWACIGASYWSTSFRRARWTWLVALGVAVSCVTVGLHTILDVIAGFAAYALIANSASLWETLRRWSERGANSWREWRVGPVRVMSHGLFIGLATLVAFPVAASLAGRALLWWVFGATMLGAVTAALWAQLVEGSPQLLRPFGYFGGMLGVLIAIGAAWIADADAWRLLTAMCVGLAFGQGIGRLRCLVNGCCHGAPAPESVGIAYVHPMPRPTRLAGLGGIPIHPTQIYSLVWLVVVGAALLRLWSYEAPLSFIAGLYFVLVGLGRFVEEHYRGEPQTAVIGGFRLYQWLTLAFVIGGAALTALDSPFAPPAIRLDGTTWAMALVTAVIGVASFGMDLPNANRRFSRLA